MIQIYNLVLIINFFLCVVTSSTTDNSLNVTMHYIYIDWHDSNEQRNFCQMLEYDDTSEMILNFGNDIGDFIITNTTTVCSFSCRKIISSEKSTMVSNCVCKSGKHT